MFPRFLTPLDNQKKTPSFAFKRLTEVAISIVLAMIAEDQVGYLAGTLAGKTTQSGVVGAVAGMEITPVVRFATGYRNGAQRASLTTTVVSFR